VQDAESNKLRDALQAYVMIMTLSIHSNCAFFKMNDFKITMFAFDLIFVCFVFFLFFEATIAIPTTATSLYLPIIYFSSHPLKINYILAGVSASNHRTVYHIK